MPGHDGLDPEPLPQTGVDLSLEIAERHLRRGLEIVHKAGEPGGVYLLELQRACVVVLVALGACQLVAQVGELAHDALNLAPNALGGFPRLEAQVRINGGAQDLAHLVLASLSVLDNASVVAVDGVRLSLELLDAPQRLLVALPTGEGLVEDLNLPPQDGRSEEHTSELQSRQYLVCRLLLEKKNTLP